MKNQSKFFWLLLLWTVKDKFRKGPFVDFGYEECEPVNIQICL
jgi:hypothetical protein